ncbi:MAG TPA: glycyl-radical enzyme activating protein [Armatimonadota bacterium]|nr:glycyl-radical enzyme activating protein [Armatimonadota bacterium]
MTSDADISGTIFDIKKFAVHDGPGIRTTVFLKGCPLSCYWCHNPESQAYHPQLAQFPRNCIGCGKCTEVCPQGGITPGPEGNEIAREMCLNCGTCTNVCYAEALVLHGREITVAEAIEEVEKDRLFYENSGGGMTISGGEPLSQPEFALALLREAKARGLHTCVDTSGDVRWEVLESAAEVTDLFLYDVKHLDSERHRDGAGRSNERIIENLKRLGQGDVPIHIRVPVVAGYNDGIEHMTQLGKLADSLPAVKEVELLRYHGLGEGKYASMGIECPTTGLEPPADEEMDALGEAVRAAGVACTVDG